MKLQLDTTAQIVRIEESVNLAELISILQSLLPNNKWRKYTLETNTKIIWKEKEPTIIDKWPGLPHIPLTPSEPPLWPWITCETKDASWVYNNYTINSGVFNVEFRDTQEPLE